MKITLPQTMPSFEIKEIHGSEELVTKSDRHPVCDVSIDFCEESHKYYLNAGDVMQTLLSVTQLVGHYTNGFDAEKVAKEQAKRKGITEAEIKLEWNDAARLGTRVHANMEHMMNGKPPPIKPDTMRERQIMAAGWDAMQAIKNAGWIPLAAEKMVLGLAWKLAGTIDAIFRRGNEVMLVDWKTNKAIRKSGFNGAKMLKPVQWLDDCEFIKYSLQLNLYERILIMEGYLPSVSETRKQLVHLTPDGFKVIQVEKMHEAEIIVLDYLVNDWFSEQPPF